MYAIQKLFFLRRIYYRRTIMGLIGDYFVVGFGLVLGYTFLSKYVYIPVGLQATIIAITVYCLLRSLARNILVNMYLRSTKHVGKSVSLDGLTGSSVNTELNGVDALRVLEYADGVKVYTAMFDFFRHAKGGDYLSKQAYYRVFEAPLIRQLPHILFDSKTSKRRQFRYTVLNSQRVSIQGPFDDRFDTYIPPHYQIDSLSLLTPEVMETMLQAHEYDIEIVDNKLLLYTPLIERATADEIHEKLIAIAKEFNDNIGTYRDDRLSNQARLSQVDSFGRVLLQNPIKHIAMASILFPISVGIITIAIVKHNGAAVNGLSFLVYAYFVINVYQAVKIIRRNRKSITDYDHLFQRRFG